MIITESPVGSGPVASTPRRATGGDPPVESDINSDIATGHQNGSRHAEKGFGRRHAQTSSFQFRTTILYKRNNNNNTQQFRTTILYKRNNNNNTQQFRTTILYKRNNNNNTSTETEQIVQLKMEEMQQQQLLQQEQPPSVIHKSEQPDIGIRQQLQQQLPQQEHQPSVIPKSEQPDIGIHQQLQQQPMATHQGQPQRQQESMFQWAPYQHLAPQQQRYQPCWNVQQQQQMPWNEQQQQKQQPPQHQPCWNVQQQQAQQKIPWNEQQQPPQQQEIPVVGNGTPWVTGTRQQWDKPGNYGEKT